MYKWLFHLIGVMQNIPCPQSTKRGQDGGIAPHGARGLSVNPKPATPAHPTVKARLERGTSDCFIN